MSALLPKKTQDGERPKLSRDRGLLASAHQVIPSAAAGDPLNRIGHRLRSGADTQTVFVLHYEEATRHSLRSLLESIELKVETYTDADSFLRMFRNGRPGCIVSGVCIPGMGGPELLDHLIERNIRIPVIFLSAHGDVPLVVRVMRAGALDFLENPCSSQQLLECVQHALHRDLLDRARRERTGAFDQLLNSLTPRERVIFEHVLHGRSNKMIGAALGISRRTVEAHRAAFMRKLGVRSLTALLHLAASVDVPRRLALNLQAH